MRTVEELQLCHRTMGKTTSIMLEIFTNLLAKVSLDAMHAHLHVYVHVL